MNTGIVFSADPDFTWKQPLPSGVVLLGVIGSRNKARFERALSNYRHAMAVRNLRRASKWHQQLLRINRQAGYGRSGKTDSIFMVDEYWNGVDKHAMSAAVSASRSAFAQPIVSNTN